MKNQSQLSWMYILVMVVLVGFVIFLPLACGKKTTTRSVSNPDADERISTVSVDPLQYHVVEASSDIPTAEITTNNSDMSPELAAFMKDNGIAGFVGVTMSLDTRRQKQPAAQ